MTELTGRLPDEFHKGILLRFLDDTTRAHLHAYHNTDTYEAFRIRVMDFVNMNMPFDKKTLAQVGEVSNGGNRGVTLPRRRVGRKRMRRRTTTRED